VFERLYELDLISLEVPTRSQNVALQRVVHHQAIGVESPAQGADRPLHALDPPPRKAIAISLVIQWNHFFVKHSQQVFSIAGIVPTEGKFSTPTSKLL